MLPPEGEAAGRVSSGGGGGGSLPSFWSRRGASFSSSSPFSVPSLGRRRSESRRRREEEEAQQKQKRRSLTRSHTSRSPAQPGVSPHGTRLASSPIPGTPREGGEARPLPHQRPLLPSQKKKGRNPPPQGCCLWHFQAKRSQSKAFKTGKKKGMNREAVPGKSPEEMYIQQKVRVLLMLRKMGSNLTSSEEEFLRTYAGVVNSQLSQLPQHSIDQGAEDGVMAFSRSETEDRRQ
ncbi:putative Catenin beta-interacting protein [Naja naja]|nr:putative Catenin beta-interacting protein [Naja naja]